MNSTPSFLLRVPLVVQYSESYAEWALQTRHEGRSRARFPSRLIATEPLATRPVIS